MAYVSAEAKTSISAHGDSYMATAFTRSTEDLLSDFDEQIAGHGVEFDTVVGVGLSGLLLLSVFGRAYDCNILALRKPGVACHVFQTTANAYGEGSIGKKWLLIDDFVSTGKTVDLARDLVDRFVRHIDPNFQTEFVGTYGYNRTLKGTANFYSPVKDVYGSYVASNKKRIYIDGKPEFVSGRLYQVCNSTYSRFKDSGSSNVKTKTINRIRNYYEDRDFYDLDEMIKILIHIENTQE